MFDNFIKGKHHNRVTEFYIELISLSIMKDTISINAILYVIVSQSATT